MPADEDSKSLITARAHLDCRHARQCHNAAPN